MVNFQALPMSSKEIEGKKDKTKKEGYEMKLQTGKCGLIQSL